MSIRRGFVSTLLLAFIIAPGASFAADYTAKPVTVVIGYPAGGALDNFARGIAEALQERLKQPFNVDNRPGASEMIATQTVARSIPNGYTLLLSTESPLTTNQFLYERIAYSPEKDFTPISLAARVPMVFAASTNFPANDAKEFIEVAKRRQKNPVVIASSGVGGITHLPVAMLAYNEGFDGCRRSCPISFPGV